MAESVEKHVILERPLRDDEKRARSSPITSDRSTLSEKSISAGAKECLSPVRLQTAEPQCTGTTDESIRRVARRNSGASQERQDLRALLDLDLSRARNPPGPARPRAWQNAPKGCPGVKQVAFRDPD